MGGGRAAPGKRCQPEQRQRREGGAARRTQLCCPSALSPRRLGTCCGVMEEHGYPSYSARSPAWEELVGTCVPCTGVSYPFSCLYFSAGGSGYHPHLCPPAPLFPSSDPAPRQSPAAGARPLPAGSGGWEPFAPAVSGHLLTRSSLWETGSSLPVLSFTARVESLGLAPRALPSTLPMGVGWMLTPFNAFS